MPVAPHIAPVLAHARSAFQATFGHQPRWAAAAPGRVNLIGEHTDYNGGFVLPIAIDRVCVAVVAPASDRERSRVLAADLKEVGEFDTRSPILSRHPDTDIATGIAQGSWLSYLAGVLAQFQRRTPVPNLDMAIASSVPIGAGLSSSAAVEVATATVLEQALSITLDPLDKARLCQKAEHEFAGVPCGIMDQYISIHAREGSATLLDCRSMTGSNVPWPRDTALLVLDSGVRHALATGEYARRRAECAAAAAKLGVPELRDADPDLLSRRAALLTGVESRRARHVVSENARTLAAARAMNAGDAATLGRLMTASHASLRDDFEVSCSELDAIVDVACSLPGVHGARMTGGGFGGSAIALAEARAIDSIVEALANHHAAHPRAVFRVVPIAGAAAIPVA